MLAQKLLLLPQPLDDDQNPPNTQNPKIHVYDRLPAPPPDPDDESQWTGSDDVLTKYYLIGLGGRGQAALKEFGVWDDDDDDQVRNRCTPVVGRRNWEPDSPPEGVQRIFTDEDKKTTAQVLPRDKLVSILHRCIVQDYADQIELYYGRELQPLDFEYQGQEQVLVQVYETKSLSHDKDNLLSPSQVKVATEEPVETLVDPSSMTLDGCPEIQQVTTDLLVAADGTVRTIANAMEAADRENPHVMDKFRVVRYPDDNQRVYKTIPLQFPSQPSLEQQEQQQRNNDKDQHGSMDWRWDVNYSARTAGSEITFDALPANRQGQYCGVLLLKKDHPLAQANTDPGALRQLLQDHLPQFNTLWNDDTVAAVARKPVSYLPAFRYVAPRLHQGSRTLLLGDCAHTVKPYFGLGANSALEDVQILGRVLDQHTHANGRGRGRRHCIDLTTAVREYSKRQAGEAAALVRMSRDLDRPGVWGAFTFVIPLILDSIFSGLLPNVFTPNVIAMLQRPEYTFTQVAERKRLDRTGQLLLIGTGLTVVTTLVNIAVGALGDWTGLQGVELWLTVGIGGGLFVVVTQNIVMPLVVEPFLQRISSPRTDLTPLRYISKDRKSLKREDEVGANGESWLVPKLLKFDNQQNKERAPK